MTAMSIAIFVIMSSWVQEDSNRYSETSAHLSNFRDLADSDIQAILQEDSTKYGTAYTYMQDLYILNNVFQTMEQYNETGQWNYTQHDFDEVAMEFTATMRLLIATVQSTAVYSYSINVLKATVANNYTYKGDKYFFIINKWYETYESYAIIDDDLKDYVNTSFAQSNDFIDIPEIKLDKWTYNLNNNLSILEFMKTSAAINYYNIHLRDVDLTLVNLSLVEVADYSAGYLYLSGKVAGIIQDFNNTLITLALVGVLMGFSASFDEKKYRRITIIIGLILLLLSIVYFMSAFGTFTSLAENEAEIFGVPDFQYF